MDERIANFESLSNFPLAQKQISPVCVHSGKKYLLNLQVSEIQRKKSRWPSFPNPHFGRSAEMAQKVWVSSRKQAKISQDFPGGTNSKEPTCQCKKYSQTCYRLGFDPWVGKIPWRREPTSVFLPGECHGQRSLADYSP